MTVLGEALVGDALQIALGAGAQVLSVSPHRETLEDLFVRRAMQAGS